MEPLCKEGDFVLLDKLSYHIFRPKAGDIVVLRHPQEDRLILKYIMSERVEDGRLLYWVEGLNKEGSSDSRSFGWVPKEMILGKALIIGGPRIGAKLGTGSSASWERPRSFPQEACCGLPGGGMIKELVGKVELLRI
ncbi:MAG: Nickel-type superoxide dismutase maturation protease [Candidatus Yanofskybacteria bacterium GW2011_GWC1_48_11]|nr:MAG: Nickel-type superoxide dismutase maturation protease [Candidatus Yanofskybacteria bacterium GW2011_GWC1_48_11]